MVRSEQHELDFEIDDPDFGVHVATSTHRRAHSNKLVTDYLERPSPWKRLTRWSLVFLIVVCFAQEAVGVYYDRKMTAVVQQVTGRNDLGVQCRRVWDELIGLRANEGWVEWGSNRASLQLGVCIDADRWSGDPFDDDNRIAIQILTHEMAHLVGNHDESQTECIAMWALPRTALALGGSAEDGRLAAQWYAT